MSFRKSVMMAGLAALAGCSSTQYLSTPYVPNKMGSQNNDQIDFDLPVVNLAGSFYGIEESKVVKPSEWKYTGTTVANSFLNENRSAGRVNLESKTNSIFVPILWDKEGDGKADREVIFATEGDYGMKAEVNLPKLEGLAGVATIKSANIRYFSPTPMLGEKDPVYTIIARDVSGARIGTLIAPVESSRILTDLDTGQQRLVGTIYMWTEKPIAAYNKERTDYLAAVKLAEDTTKQIEADKALLEKNKLEGKLVPSTIVHSKEAPKQDPPQPETPKK